MGQGNHRRPERGPGGCLDVALLVRIGVEADPPEVNGQPGAIFRDRDNKALNAWTLDVLDGQIQTIRSMQNPDKLEHVGPAADAWGPPRGEPASTAHGLTGRADCAPDRHKFNDPPG